MRADAAIVTEPTELELVVAHQGFVWSEVEVTGRAAHGSRPHLGVDAIVKTGPILTALGALDEALDARIATRCSAAPSVHASVIAGGEELSSYPARCVARHRAPDAPGRDAPPTSRPSSTRCSTRCRAADPGARRPSSERCSCASRSRSRGTPPIVGLVGDAIADALGAPPAIGGASYWADAAFIAAAGIPTVMFGPSGEGAHALEEWVSLSDTEAVARVLVAVARRVCA